MARRKKDLVSLLDWEADEIRDVLRLGHQLKRQAFEGRLEQTLRGKTLALAFEKSSMRTRVSFEVAVTQLGGHAIYLSKDDINLGVREPVKDGARVLSRYVDGIAARTRSHATVEELAAFAGVPVINALSDLYHPCQALGDMMTIEEKLGAADRVSVAFVGDANNVARSLAVICARLAIDFAIAAPRGYQFTDDFRQKVAEIARLSGSAFRESGSPPEVVRAANVVYTDTWVSMGQEEEAEERVRAFAGFRVDAELLRAARDGAVVMHCLPAHRGEEITDEVLEGPQSAVFDQAENRLHAQRAVLQLLMAD